MTDDQPGDVQASGLGSEDLDRKAPDTVPEGLVGDELPAVLTAPPRVLPDAPLGGTENEYGEVDGAVAFVPVGAFPTQTEATGVARHLVEAGIGATVAETDPDDRTDPESVYEVHVLPEDRRRAAELLGLVEPEDRPRGDGDEPMVLEKGPTPWKSLVAIWLVAMIVVPAGAFALTYLVMSR